MINDSLKPLKAKQTKHRKAKLSILQTILSDTPTSNVSLGESRSVRMNKQKFVTFTKMVSESVIHVSNRRPD